MLYRVDVMGFEDNNMAPYHYCVHGMVADGSLMLRFFDNIECMYDIEEVVKIIEWVNSRKWLTVQSIVLRPFNQ